MTEPSSGQYVDGNGAVWIDDLTPGDYVPGLGVVHRVHRDTQIITWKDHDPTFIQSWKTRFEGVRRVVIEEDPI